MNENILIDFNKAVTEIENIHKENKVFINEKEHKAINLLNEVIPYVDCRRELIESIDLETIDLAMEIVSSIDPHNSNKVGNGVDVASMNSCQALFSLLDGMKKNRKPNKHDLF